MVKKDPPFLKNFKHLEHGWNGCLMVHQMKVLKPLQHEIKAQNWIILITQFLINLGKFSWELFNNK